MALGGLLIAGVAGGLARRVLFVVRIDGESMEPTFRPDDVVLALRSRASPVIRRGDVVVCRLPAELQGPTGYLVKRVTAVAGDPVPRSEPVEPGGPRLLAAGRIYLQGDGARSYDSTTFGDLPVDAVHGRVIARLTGSARPAAKAIDRPIHRSVRTTRAMQYLALACRTAIAVVFLMAVGGKTIGRGAFAEFTRSIVAMNAVPKAAAGLAARATVSAELLTVLLVSFPARITAVIGSGLAALLMALFSGAIWRSLRRGDNAPCRCFGRSSTPLGRRHLVRNGLLLLTSALGIGASLVDNPLHVAAALVSLVAGLFVGVALATFDDIFQLIAPAQL